MVTNITLNNGLQKEVGKKLRDAGLSKLNRTKAQEHLPGPLAQS